MDLKKDRFLHKLNFARKMPLLDKKEIFEWLLESDNAKVYLMMVLASDPNPLIMRDAATNKWHGVDYDN